MKLSFIIPAYNEEARLGQCLDSISREIENTPGDFEIIVVNNGSTDRTKEIALARGVRVVDEYNKGLTKARQAGYLAAAGDILANVDADNMLTSGWVSRVLAEFSKDDELVGLSGPVVFHDLSWLVNLQTKMFYYIGYLAYLLNHFIFKKGGMMQGGNFVVRKTALDKVGGFDTSIVFFGEDTDIARRLGKVGYVKFTFDLPILSSGRRLAQDGVVTTGWRYAVNYFWVLIFKKPYHDKPAAEIRTSKID